MIYSSIVFIGFKNLISSIGEKNNHMSKCIGVGYLKTLSICYRNRKAQQGYCFRMRNMPTSSLDGMPEAIKLVIPDFFLQDS